MGETLVDRFVERHPWVALAVMVLAALMVTTADGWLA